MSIQNYIRIALCIGLLCFIFFYQRPFVYQQLIDLEKQKAAYEAQKRFWHRDSIRRAHVIIKLDSLILRNSR
jgi:hypothetical protein